ncbi:MAG: LysM peptidoglycan-binding domain-containing protein [Paludibacter sp.]|nr:LysM peptidoglycan-binding domain-containing protein [Paludibacter sp.]
MKKQLFSFILIGFFLISLSGIAQNKNYPIKKINGVEYYQYKVAVSEGLFAIGRKFEISPEDISKANPDIKNGLKAGQEILIPVQKKTVSEKSVKSITEPAFIEHKVEKNQTLFAISRKYNVSQDEIIKYNQGIEKGLHEGLVIRIPKNSKENSKKDIEKPTDKEIKTKEPENHQKQNFVTHQVQLNETLYSISKKYKVEVSDIIKFNPGSQTVLSTGVELKIPVKEGATKPTLQKKEETTTANPNPLIDINSFINPGELAKIKNSNRVIRIGFLLPFMLDQDKKDASTDKFIDFYVGSLIAIKDAQEKGISFEIYTYDTEKSEEKLVETLANSELKTMDLIVGPAFSNQVSLIGDFAKENRINTLIPFTSKVSDIENNPYLFQFNPGTDAVLEYANELFTDKYKDVHIIFAELPGISSMDDGKSLSEGLQYKLKKSKRLFSTIELSTSDVADFGSVLKAGEKNIVIFNTDKYADVSPFIAPLQAASKEYDVVLYEQYGWKNQSEKLKQTMYISPFISEMNTTKLNAFNQKYYFYLGKKVNAETPRFDLLGYDLTNYFVALYQRYGNKFADKIGTFNFTYGIQSQPKFEAVSNGSGFVNQHVYLGEN